LRRWEFLPLSLMVKTKVVNKTEFNIILKEGCMGAYHTLFKLEPGKTNTIEVDATATYCDFMCQISDSAKYVVLSSNTCMENMGINIILNPDNEYTWEPSEREEFLSKVHAISTGIWTKVWDKVKQARH